MNGDRDGHSIPRRRADPAHLRDVAKADEFHLSYLGFKIDWDHRFDDNAPVYRQAPRGGFCT